MALTNDVPRVSMRRGYQIAVTLTSGKKYHKGALIAIDTTTGKGVSCSDAANRKFVGYLEEPVDASAGDTEGYVVADDKVWLPFAGAAITDMTKKVYPTDDDTIAFTATNIGSCGVVVGVEAGQLLIDTAKAAV